MGAEQHALFEQAQEETPGFALVASMELDFLGPRGWTTADVVTWPVAVKGASITLAQEVRRGDDAGEGQGPRRLHLRGTGQADPETLRLLMKADLEYDDSCTDRYKLPGRQPGEMSCASAAAPFTRETAAQKARRRDAELRDPVVSLAYRGQPWRNRLSFLNAALRSSNSSPANGKGADYRLIKDLWAFDQTVSRCASSMNGMTVPGTAPTATSSGIDEHGLMRRREASINDIAIGEERRFHWPAPGPRPADVAGLSENPL
jgi:nuclear transport factor 2 (NTF2) superfamily protein